jgi:hypothetical protein
MKASPTASARLAGAFACPAGARLAAGVPASKGAGGKAMLFVLPVLGMLTACGPVPLKTAESICFDRARLAAAPRGEVKIGVSNGKPAGSVSVGVTSDYILGRDPSAVYDQCVLQKSGQMPSLPLYSRPDWTG